MMQFNVSSSERDYETDYDVVIIGAGAAGYSAGVYIKRSGMSVAILERESVPGGNTAVSPLVENYLGYTAIEGADLAENFRKHYAQYGKIKKSVSAHSTGHAATHASWHATGSSGRR